MKKIGTLIALALVSGVLNVGAKPNALDLAAQVGKEQTLSKCLQQGTQPVLLVH